MSVPTFKVLIVDDNSDESSVYGWYLTKIKDFKVALEYATSGAAGIKKASATEYDLMILDYQMPEMNGIEVLGKLKEAGLQVPVVMMTGGGGERIAVESLKLGAIDYVLKEDLPKTDFAGLVRRAIEMAQLKAEKKELERLTAVKNQFLELLAKDFRDPMVKAFGAIDMLLGERLGRLDAGQKDGIALVQREVQKIYDLIEDLVNLREFSLRPEELSRKKLSLRQLVRDRVEAHKRFFEQKGIVCELSFDEDALELEGDGPRLQCVLDNVLSNALHNTPYGGRVGILTRRHNGSAELSVADTGRGLSQEARGRLFETFYKSEKRLGRRFDGLGIGLAVSKHITEAHGGALNLTSEGADTGALVTITLPLPI